MSSEPSRVFARCLFALDLCLQAGAALAGRALLGEPGHDATGLLLFLAAQLWCWWLVSVRLHVYDAQRGVGLLRELVAVGEALLLSTGLACAVALAVQQGVPLRVEVPLLLALAALWLVRVLARLVLGRRRARDLHVRQLLLVGRGSAAHRLAENLRLNPHYGMRLAGALTFVDEASTAAIDGVRHLGVLADIQRVLATTAIDEVVVCPSGRTPMAEVQAVLQLCGAIGTRCRLAPDFLGLSELARPSLAWCGDVPTLRFRTGAGEPLAPGLRRLLDVVGAALALVLLLPVLVLVALAVRLGSRGPVLVRERRCGLRGREFTCYRFRVTAIAAAGAGAAPAVRFTPVGRWLRQRGLDDLPQLLHVLRGDLGLFGPRAPTAAEVQRYDWWQRRRLSVKPGLFCLWQGAGRGQMAFDRWVELDLAYIDSAALSAEADRLARTLGGLVRNAGL